MQGITGFLCAASSLSHWACVRHTRTPFTTHWRRHPDRADKKGREVNCCNQLCVRQRRKRGDGQGRRKRKMWNMKREKRQTCWKQRFLLFKSVKMGLTMRWGEALLHTEYSFRLGLALQRKEKRCSLCHTEAWWKWKEMLQKGKGRLENYAPILMFARWVEMLLIGAF